MEIKFKDSSPEKVKTDLLALPVKENEVGPAIQRLDRLLKKRLSERVTKSKFTGTEGTTLLYSSVGMAPASHVLLIGMGKEREIEGDAWRRAAGRARKEASSIGAEDIAFFLFPEQEPGSAVRAISEGVTMASYRFDKYRSDKKLPPPLRAVTFFKPGLKRTQAMERSARLVLDLTPGVFLARDLVNEPPSVTTARYLGEQAKQHCRGKGLSVEVWGKKKIQEMNLAGLLAVNRGSTEEPRFIIIRYKPARARKKVALIGKGITFDSGGLSLKPPKSMETMKLDMAGGAAVIGAMSRLPYLRPDIEVTGYIPTTDNLPSGSAQKPGDIIRYLNGKTVEVLNTDAEGRLILADGLALAAKGKPDCMINLATLTGACMVALGSGVAGIFGNHQPLVDNLIRCGGEVGRSFGSSRS